jgi:hypothetical protein
MSATARQYSQPANNRLEELVDPRVSQSTTLEQVLAATEERRVTNVMEQARIAHRSGYLPKYIQTPDQAIAIALAGHELGIAPMTAFRVIYFFDGRVVLSAQLLVALAHKRVENFRIDIVKATEAGCWLRAWRPGMTEPAPFYFTIQDAQRANLLGKDNWKKYPTAMCIARAQSMAVRAIAPEAMLGALAKEEIDDGVRYEVDLGPQGLEVTTVAAPQHSAPQALAPQQPPAQAPAAVENLKADLRQRGRGSSRAEKEAERRSPPPGFADADPTAPPPGFAGPGASSAKGAADGKGEPAKPEATPPKEKAPETADEFVAALLKLPQGDGEAVNAWWYEHEAAIKRLPGEDFDRVQVAAADRAAKPA